MGRNYFPGLEGVPVRENKKVTFLLYAFLRSGLVPAPVLSAGEQAGAVSAHPRSGLTPAGVSRSAGGQGRRRHNSGRPIAGKRWGRKILQRTMFLEPRPLCTCLSQNSNCTPPLSLAPSVILKRGCRTGFSKASQMRNIHRVMHPPMAQRSQIGCETRTFQNKPYTGPNVHAVL